jgi:FemAB-related protein (PEP-CTERM system-associated)
MQIIHVSNGEDEKRWDQYVGGRTTSVLDLWAWRRIVRDVYGMQSHFLAAVEGERIVGTLGLFEVKHPLLGHYLATAAFGNDGGLHFDHAAAQTALADEARNVADGLNVEYMVIRTRDVDLAGFQVDRRYSSARIDLEGGAERVWKNRLPAKTRNQVRKGMKEGFSVATGPTQLGPFFDVFHAHMRDLGSPAHHRRFYESIVDHFGDRSELVVVRDGSDVAAGALLFWINGTATNLHTVSLRKYNRRCPNYLIYWTMIEASCGRGCKWFDMGRSQTDSPNFRFKLNWGPQPVPLHYNYYLRTAKEIPYVYHKNLKYRLPIALWQALPLFVTRRLGPRLIWGLA